MSHSSKKRVKSTSTSGTQSATDISPNGSSILNISLKSFTSNVFYGLLIQDDEKIFREVLDKNFSPNVDENENGVSLNFQAFFKLVQNFRTTLTNRFLVDQSFVVSSDDGGVTGTVGHATYITGIQAGKRVNVSTMDVLQIELENGRRVITDENIALEMHD